MMTIKENSKLESTFDTQYGVALEEKASSLTCGSRGLEQESSWWARFSEN